MQATSNRNRVTLLWIPEHSELVGNERADELAREAYTAEAKYTKRWLTNLKCRLTKNWVETPWYGSRSLLHSLNDRDSVRLLVGMYTSHCLLNQHRFRMGLTHSPQCDNCEAEIESPFHFLAECPRYLMERLIYLGELYPQMCLLCEIPKIMLVAYMNATDRLRNT